VRFIGLDGTIDRATEQLDTYYTGEDRKYSVHVPQHEASVDDSNHGSREPLNRHMYLGPLQSRF